MRLIVFTIFSLVFSTAAALGQLIPGQDAYHVEIDAAVYPNGHSTPARQYVVTRPSIGTTVHGVVLVKTRTIHGFHNNERAIDGSSANAVLATVDVRGVTSAYTTQMSSISTENLEYEKVAGLDRIYEVRYDEPLDPFDLCLRLMTSPDVEYAVPVYVQNTHFIPNDPRYPDQTWLKNMGLEEAWDITKGSENVLIAVVDSGTDWQHEDLSSRIWTNPGEIPNNGVDDDQNGYIDDVRGWDFVGNITVAEAQQGVRRPDNDPRIDFPVINAQNGHGTTVAGCVAAHTNNSTGIAAPGYNCKIIPIKCGSDNSANRGIYDGYQAIRYAADLGADVINCSWGGPGVGPGVQEVIDYATAKGSLVVAASGNDGLNNDSYQQSPAVLDGVLSVGSSTNADGVSGFSNYGWSTYVYAPGNNIWTTAHGNRYSQSTGTSFSSPLTAGVCGLIKSLHPSWTPEMIREQLRSTASPLANIPGGVSNRPSYFGRVDAKNALTLNRNGFSGQQTIPGIKVKAVKVENKPQINNYEPTNVDIELKNVLGDAQNVTAQFISRTSGVTFNPGGLLDYGTLVHNANKTARLVVQLNENFPWYETNITLEVTLKSGSYINYVLVDIPVRLPTTNVHTNLAQIPGFVFNDVAVSNDGTLYASGTYQSSPIFIRGTANGGGGAATFVPSDIAVINTSNVLFAGMRSTTATIAKSTDAGQSWNNIAVSSLMSSVEGIHMYDNTNGIAAGNPSSNRFGVASTANAGLSWQALSSTPLTNNAGEKIIPGSVFFLDDGMWFATTERRIVFTKNKGQSFGSGRFDVANAVIVSVAFKDENNGVMLYKTSTAVNAPTRIAHSANSGAAWVPDRFDPSSLGISAIAVNSSGGHHLLIGANGEVFGSDNNGDDWQPVLSKPSGTVASTFVSGGASPSIFFAGTGVSDLEYRYNGPNGTKILEITSDMIDYDTIEVDRSRQRYIQVTNVGEADVTVDSVVITNLSATPDSAFRITGELDQIIIAGKNKQMAVRCYGTDTGKYEAIVTIYTNATPPTLTANLVAYVVDPPVSVEEELLVTGVSIAPNPTSDEYTITLPLPARITMVNVVGQPVQQWVNKASGTMQLNVKGLPAGTYSLVVQSANAVRTVPVIIQR